MKKLRSKKVDKKKEDVSIEAIEEVSTIKNRKETEKSMSDIQNDGVKEKQEESPNKKDKKEMSLKSKIIRTTIVILIIAGIIVLGYYILIWTGVWEKVNTAEKLRELILSWGFWGRLGYVFISFLQVTFIPLPSTVTIIAGTLLYGPLQAALLSLAGILLGSMLAFFLGRFFGRKLVVFMVGEKTCEKWVHFLNNAKYSFFIMMLLPIFPDDVLCLVAGLTNMSWTFFTLTNLICRPIGILTVSYFGSGYIIPYHGWGLVVWAIIIVAIIAIIILSYKYQKQIENFILKVFKNKDKKDKNVVKILKGKKANTVEAMEKKEESKENDKQNKNNKTKENELKNSKKLENNEKSIKK